MHNPGASRRGIARTCVSLFENLNRMFETPRDCSPERLVSI